LIFDDITIISTMSKRINDTDTSSNKKTRSRSHPQRPSDQPSIDSFFKSPRTAVNHPAESLNSNLPTSSSQSRPPQPSSISHRATPVTSTIIDVDLTSDSEDIHEIPTILSFPASRAAIASTSTLPPPQYPNLSVDLASFLLDTCPWPTTGSAQAPYSFLVHALCALSATRSRVVILNTLANALRVITRYHPPSILPSLYLLSNSLAPPYMPIELGLGPSIISKAIQHVSGITPAALKRLYNQTGDPGDVAFLAKCSVRTLVPHAPLSISGVYDMLLKIADIKGKGAVSRKQTLVEKLLVATKGEETRYLVRTLSQHIRVGAVRTTILTALARALVLTPPATVISSTPSSSSYIVSTEFIAHAQADRASETSVKKKESSKTLLLEKFASAEALLRKVFVQHPNYDHIISAILEVGLDGLTKKVPLTVGKCTSSHPDRVPYDGDPYRDPSPTYSRISHAILGRCI
jgi:DNA ligase 1